MSNDTRIEELLRIWEEHLRRGDPISVEVLCQDAPELIPSVRQRLAEINVLARSSLSDTDTRPAQPSENQGWFSNLDVPHEEQFETIRELGRGGMGVIYLAKQVRLDRLVAIKMVLAGKYASPADLQRFFKEAQLIARLSHPNIVPIYDLGTKDGIPYYVMEYLAGGGLETVIRTHTLTPQQAAEVVEALARGLQHAHDNNIIHRDMKPANVLLTSVEPEPDGGVRLGTPKLADFGLARNLENKEGLTQTGMVAGTPGYMAPEQVLAANDRIGPATDIFGLGILLYRLLTRQLPFEGITPYDQQRLLLETEPVRPSKRSGIEMGELDAICLRCLAKDPTRRYPSAVALADDLKRYLESAPEKAATRSTQPPSWWTRRSVLGTMGLAVAGSLGYGIWRWATPDEPIRVGILQSFRGTMAANGSAAADAAVLAIEELNTRGGVLHRPIEAILADGESDDERFRLQAVRLLRDENVHVIFGCWTGGSRRAVRGVVEEYKNLLMYPAQFEGLERSPYLVYLGAAPNQLSVAVYPQFKHTLEKDRIFIVGSQTIFAKACIEILKALSENDREQSIVGIKYVDFAGDCLLDVLRAIDKVRPNGILNLLSGDTNALFFREWARRGIPANDVPILSIDFSERDMRALRSDQVAGHYLASSYYQGLPGKENEQFIASMRKKYGVECVATDGMEASYAGVHLWAKAVEAVGSPEVGQVRRTIVEQKIQAPGGLLRIDPDSRYARKMARLLQIQENGTLKEVWNSGDPIAPQPYPRFLSQEEWDVKLVSWYREWNGRWSKE